jgi:putative transcriptional regulator
MELKFKLKQLLQERGITQSQLCIDTKISRPTIGRLYNNNCESVHLSTLETLCEYFDCELQELIDFEKN